MTLPIKLSGTDPVARGSARLVYQHPQHEDLLIKIPRDNSRARWHTKPTIFGPIQVNRRYGIYTAEIREILEYVAVRARLPRHPNCMQPVLGLTETDHGLGLVVGKIRGRDGGLAPTLDSRVATDGYTIELRSQLLELKRQVERIDIATGDLNCGGILCANLPELGDYMVVVDGLGDKTFLRINTWSRILRTQTNNRHFRRIEKQAVRASRSVQGDARQTN